MTKKVSILCLFLALLATVSCQTFSYGPPVASHSRNAANAEQSDPKTFESMEKKEKKDPAGTLLLIGLGIAAGVATATLVPLALAGKL